MSDAVSAAPRWNLRKILGILAAVVVVGVLAGIGYWATVCPCERLPGAILLGERVDEPVADWSFANNVELCQIQISAGWRPHALNLNCMATAAGNLYLSCSVCDTKYWASKVADNPRGRLRLNGLVYPVTINRVTDPAEMDQAWQARIDKLQTVGGPGNPAPPATAPRDERWWTFRVSSVGVPPQSITAKEPMETELHRHIEILSSDAFGGRAPATPGETLTIDYLQAQFRSLGLQPGNGDSYLQAVPVTEITADSNVVLSLRGSDYYRDLAYADEMVVATYQEVEGIGITDSELVFVGYGIVAPEQGWNDYADVDVRGKTVVILVNDPGYATQNPERFNGNTMTWYGRWPYKYEEAARQGAAGALIIHETGAAAYGWDVVRNSWTGPQIVLSEEDLGADKNPVIGWLTQESARDLFDGAGLDFDALVAAAAEPDFRAVPIGDIKASASLTNVIRRSMSNNVIAMIPGSERPDETIIYTAHWDHLGVNAELAGDNIYNGAADNASGTAALLSLARLFMEHPQPPRRSVVFLAVTAEESGLLGSQWYAQNPLFPIATTVANINMDNLKTASSMRDVVVVGYGNSELEDYLEDAVAQQQGRYVAPEPHPERGLYYRSDHLNFARQGVPALFARSGQDSITNGREWGAAQAQDYTDNRYHSPADEYQPDWDVSGMVQDIQLYFVIGHRLSQEDTWPNWYDGNEFKAIRDASAAARNP